MIVSCVVLFMVVYRYSGTVTFVFCRKHAGISNKWHGGE